MPRATKVNIMNIWIYTRTSSTTTFKKDSPDRQKASCINYIEKIKGVTDIRGQYSDNCNGDILIFERERWLALINEIGSGMQREEQHEIYTESQSRLSRSTANQETLRDWLKLNKNVKVIPIGNEDIFATSDEVWKILSGTLSRMMYAEVERQRDNQAFKRDKARNSEVLGGLMQTSKGKVRFDGRMLYMNKHPGQLGKITKLRAEGRSLESISHIQQGQGIVGYKGNPISPTTIGNIQKYPLSLQSRKRQYSTSVLREWEGLVGAIKDTSLEAPVISGLPVLVISGLPVLVGSEVSIASDQQVGQGMSADVVQEGINVSDQQDQSMGAGVLEEIAPRPAVPRLLEIPNLVNKFKGRQALGGDYQIWDDKREVFYIYKSSNKYWTSISEIQQDRQIQTKQGDQVFSKLTAIVRGLKIYATSIKDIEFSLTPDSRLQGFNNGVYNLETKELQPHGPFNATFSQIPHDYVGSKVPLRRMRRQIKWQKFITRDDRPTMQFFVYFAYQVVHSITTHHIYQELQGPGGTGKSTALNILTALVERDSVHITDQVTQEQNRFEGSRIENKKLILITDSPSYRGNVSKLKAIIGGDAITAEEKGKQRTDKFIAKGQVVISSNEHLASKDYSTGLSRRRITYIMDRMPPTNSRVMNQLSQTMTPGLYEGLFGPEIPYLLNYILNLSKDQVNHAIANRESQYTVIQDNSLETLANTNPIYSFIVQALTYVPDSKKYMRQTSNIDPRELKEMQRRRDAGLPWQYSQRDEIEYHPTLILAIYPMYEYHCDKLRCKPVSLNQFTNLFIDNFYKVHGVKQIKTKAHNGIIFYGAYPSETTVNS